MVKAVEHNRALLSSDTFDVDVAHHQRIVKNRITGKLAVKGPPSFWLFRVVFQIFFEMRLAKVMPVVKRAFQDLQEASDRDIDVVYRNFEKINAKIDRYNGMHSSRIDTIGTRVLSGSDTFNLGCHFTRDDFLRCYDILEASEEIWPHPKGSPECSIFYKIYCDRHRGPDLVHDGRFPMPEKDLKLYEKDCSSKPDREDTIEYFQQRFGMSEEFATQLYDASGEEAKLARTRIIYETSKRWFLDHGIPEKEAAVMTLRAMTYCHQNYLCWFLHYFQLHVDFLYMCCFRLSLSVDTQNKGFLDMRLRDIPPKCPQDGWYDFPRTNKLNGTEAHLRVDLSLSEAECLPSPVRFYSEGL